MQEVLPSALIKLSSRIMRCGLRCRRDKYKNLTWKPQWTTRLLQRFFVQWKLLSLWSRQTELSGSGYGAKVGSLLLRRRKIRTRLNKHADLDVYWQLKVGPVSEFNKFKKRATCGAGVQRSAARCEQNNDTSLRRATGATGVTTRQWRPYTCIYGDLVTMWGNLTGWCSKLSRLLSLLRHRMVLYLGASLNCYASFSTKHVYIWKKKTDQDNKVRRVIFMLYNIAVDTTKTFAVTTFHSWDQTPKNIVKQLWSRAGTPSSRLFHTRAIPVGNSTQSLFFCCINCTALN